LQPQSRPRHAIFSRGNSERLCDLRAASPTATPNARLVRLADAALERNGRMNAAITEIGRG
jgi:predicted protein tyrosine phosphatase